MNLILQAIKSMLWGLENRISANVATLSAKVANVRTTANAANKTATKALTKANYAQDNAEDAISRANNAQTTAEDAQTAASDAMTKATRAHDRTFPVNVDLTSSPTGKQYNMYDLLKIQVGESYVFSEEGKMTNTQFRTGGVTYVKIQLYGSSHTSYQYMMLTASGLYTASGIHCMAASTFDIGSMRVYIVLVQNAETTSTVTFYRIV